MWVTTLTSELSRGRVNASMNWLPTRIIVFGFTVCLEIFIVWMFAKPAQVSLQTPPIEQQPTPVVVTERPSVSTRPFENAENRVEKTRIEQFADDKRIGRQGRNKIEIECFSLGDERFAEIKFYSRSDYGAWIEVQSFKFDKDGVTDCDPVTDDFNNDGFKDFTFRSAVAARGANETRKLFIYDKKQDELIYITNSENYPNMVYNKRLDCIDAWLFHGATTTVFLKIDGNQLKEFATVNTGLELIAEVVDNDGQSHVISREKMKEADVYTRYIDFEPVTPYR
jgi:hypothetical protein